MNENKENPLSFLVTGLTWVIDVIERVLVGILDGIRNATDHASPSIFGVVAVLLPFLTPIPVAYLSARSAMHFFSFDPAIAWVLAISVEGLGLISWVATVDAFLEHNNRVFYVFGGVAITYEILLIALNVGLTLTEGASALYATVLFLICAFPALSAFFYGSNKRMAEARLAAAKQEAKDEAEKIRQERRADRKEAAAQRLQYASNTKGEKLETPPFRKSKP